jgi:hypothetical protein
MAITADEGGGVPAEEGPDSGPAYRGAPERERAQAAHLRRRRLAMRPAVRFSVGRRRAAAGSRR